MAKVFLIDVGRCSGCYNCQMACKDEHCGNEWLPYAAAQPDTGQFWLKIQENVCGTIPKVKIHYIPQMCNHCDHAVCMDACADGAISRRTDGLVLIEPEKCSGCRKCLDACPYGAIYFNEEKKLAQKCTGCAHLLDNGYKLPRCVEACPTDALKFGEEEDLREELKDAVPLNSQYGTGPRVYYKRIPGRFIAGTLYDPVQREVLIGAHCRLTAGETTLETETDDFGDFWFRDLPVGSFDLSLTASGFREKRFPALCTEKDINLGDVPMEAE